MLAVVGCQAAVVVLLTVLGVGSRSVHWGPLTMLVIMMVMLMVEVAPVCRRVARGWGRTALVARELRAAGGSVVTAGTLVAWTRSRGYARELISILTRKADLVGVNVVIDAADADLAETYRRYGLRPRCAEDPLLLVRVASWLCSVIEPVPGTREP